MRDRNQELEERVHQLEAENQRLSDRIQGLEADNAKLLENGESLIFESEVLKKQIQELRQELSKAAPTMPNLESVRDRVLKNWRLAKGPEKKERIAEALDRFIEELKKSTPP